MEDCILHVKILPQAEISLGQVIEILKRSKKLWKGEKIPILSDMSNVKYISRDSRAFLSSEEAVRVTKSLAMVGNSQISKVIGNFILGLNNPPYPVKLFTSKDKALQWLEMFVEK